jgi:hypothetical protein
MNENQVVREIASGDLGPHAYSVQHRMGQARILFRAMLFGSPVLFVVLLANFIVSGGDWTMIFLLILFASSFCLVLWILRDSNGRQLLVFRDGIEFVRGSASIRLRFTEIDVFSFQAISHYVNGAYAGLHYKLTFQTTNHDSRKPVEWSSVDNKPQEELESLKDRVAFVVAKRKMEILSARGSVDWTKGLTIYRDRLSCEPNTFRKNVKDRRELRFEEIERVEIQKASCYIFRPNENSPAIVCPCDEPNFYPGLILLSSLLKPQSKNHA